MSLYPDVRSRIDPTNMCNFFKLFKQSNVSKVNVIGLFLYVFLSSNKSVPVECCVGVIIRKCILSVTEYDISVTCVNIFKYDRQSAFSVTVVTKSGVGKTDAHK